MVYSFYFAYHAGNNDIYVQIGFDSFSEAKSKLEEIASIYCRTEKDTATGRISEKEGTFRILKEYDITYKNKHIELKEKITERE